VEESGCKLHLVKHDFNYKSIEKHCKSFLKPCGHPWAALVYFDALLVSQLHHIPLVYLGHEKSADEGNGVYVNGVEVNHQYDKSTAFLQMASEYTAKYITPNIQIRSAVKNMWEIEICKIFCLEESLKKYHHLFISCNEVSGERPCEWCKKCEKCAFIFLLMSAWTDISYVVNTVFGGVNMLLDDSEKMQDIFLSLLGGGKSEGKKPFECVGTVQEASTAVQLAVERITQVKNEAVNMKDALVDESALPKILKILWDFCRDSDHYVGDNVFIGERKRCGIQLN